MNEDKEKDGQEIDESNEVTEPSHEDDLNTAETPTTETEEDPENGAEVGGEKNDGEEEEEEEAPKEDGKTQGQTNYNRANKIDNNYYKISLLDKEQVTQLYKALSGKTEEGFSNRFSMKMLDIIQGKEIAISSTKSSFIAEDSWYQRGITILKEHRVLLLEGAKKDGVSDIALWMAYKMNKSKDVDTIYLSEAMGAQVRINLNKDIAENKEAFQNSVVLLEEAIKKNNKDLNTFLQKTASSKSSIGTHLKSKLKAINSFLILTLERNEIARYTGLAEKVNTITIPSLSDDKKQEYLTFKLRALQQKGTLNQNQKDAIDNVSQNEINTIVKQLPNINDLDRFVIRIEEKLILSGENLLDPKAVLGIIQSIKNIRQWLIGDLGKTLNSWHFIFCTTLLYSYPDESEQSVSLIEFEYFRNKLEAFLKEKSKMKQEHENWVGLFPEAQLLRQCRVAKRKDKVTGQNCLVFEQTEYMRELWQILLSDLSLNLVQIVPFLRQLIAKNTLPYTAGRILGRIGEIDALQTLHWMNQWANSNEIQERVLVSYVMQGVLASSDLEYKTTCESFISKLGHSANFNQVWTAIVAYMEIGRCKLQFAIDELAEITDRRLSSSYELFRKLRAEKSWASSKVERHELYNEYSFDEFKDYLLSTIEKKLYDHIIEEKAKQLKYNQQTFLTVSYAITTLCRRLDPISVLQACRSWFNKDKRSVKILLIKMLLPKNGILDQLNWKIGVFKQDSNTIEDWHFMVRAISIGEEAIHTIVGLLEDSAAVFPSLEPGEAKAMTKLIIDHLISWVRASIDLQEANNQMIELFAHITFKVKHLERPLWHKIETWAEPKQKNLKLKVFAAKVKQKIKTLESENRTSLSLSSLQRK